MARLTTNQDFKYTLHTIPDAYNHNQTVYFFEVDPKDFQQNNGLYEWKQFSFGQYDHNNAPGVDPVTAFTMSRFVTEKRLAFNPNDLYLVRAINPPMKKTLQ